MVRIRKTEGESLEFKSCRSKCGAKLPENLWQTIIAFANTRGGSVLLGVSDSGEIKPDYKKARRELAQSVEFGVMEKVGENRNSRCVIKK